MADSRRILGGFSARVGGGWLGPAEVAEIFSAGNGGFFEVTTRVARRSAGRGEFQEGWRVTEVTEIENVGGAEERGR